MQIKEIFFYQKHLLGWVLLPFTEFLLFQIDSLIGNDKNVEISPKCAIYFTIFQECIVLEIWLVGNWGSAQFCCIWTVCNFVHHEAKVFRVRYNPFFSAMKNKHCYRCFHQKQRKEKHTTPKQSTSGAFNNTGIKHDFPFINIRKVPKEVLKTEGGDPRFSTPPEGPCEY